MFLGTFMACIYALGTVFKFALVIAIVAWISALFYLYAIIKDYSHGQFTTDNRFVEPVYDKLDLEGLLKELKEDIAQKEGKTVDEIDFSLTNSTQLGGGRPEIIKADQTQVGSGGNGVELSGSGGYRSSQIDYQTTILRKKRQPASSSSTKID
jgi:hypothetical protein